MEKYKIFEPYDEELKQLNRLFEANKNNYYFLKKLHNSCKKLQEKIHSVKITDELLSYSTVLVFSVSYLSTEIWKQILFLENGTKK